MNEKYLTMEQKSVIIRDLLNLAMALELAEKGRWMAQEHAKNVWRYHLAASGMDLEKGGEKVARKKD